jgi:hypothetical protein
MLATQIGHGQRTQEKVKMPAQSVDGVVPQCRVKYGVVNGADEVQLGSNDAIHGQQSCRS